MNQPTCWEYFSFGYLSSLGHSGHCLPTEQRHNELLEFWGINLAAYVAKSLTKKHEKDLLEPHIYKSNLVILADLPSMFKHVLWSRNKGSVQNLPLCKFSDLQGWCCLLLLLSFFLSRSMEFPNCPFQNWEDNRLQATPCWTPLRQIIFLKICMLLNVGIIFWWVAKGKSGSVRCAACSQPVAHCFQAPFLLKPSYLAHLLVIGTCDQCLDFWDTAFAWTSLDMGGHVKEILARWVSGLSKLFDFVTSVWQLLWSISLALKAQIRSMQLLFKSLRKATPEVLYRKMHDLRHEAKAYRLTCCLYHVGLGFQWE